ncbi:MAG: hypothetical protein EWM72_01725 [Nitrospira sp.]|nr:MAG: hypothetical protein EWM72_01725 [Nitrospira sp.]
MKAWRWRCLSAGVSYDKAMKSSRFDRRLGGAKAGIVLGGGEGCSSP